MSTVLDLLVVALVLAAAVATVTAAGTRAAVIGFVVLGLLLSMAWVRLDAVDVALTEAAIGGGATGLLLLRAVGRLSSVPVAPPPAVVRLLAAAAAIGLTAALSAIVLGLPEPAPSLAAPAAAGLDAFGLGNPVTAVLLGYRALDTLLEKIVMLLAVAGVWALARDSAWNGRPATIADEADDGTLALMARVLAPVGIVVAVYLVWVGADQPGGTFQAGAVLAGVWLLSMMAGGIRPPVTGAFGLRFALVAGPAGFIAVGFAGVALADAFLAYPPAIAKPVIIAVELVLTVTVAAVVALLVLGPATEDRR
jgi:multisubunit Na+/H+ antiporter MnhB subunit